MKSLSGIRRASREVSASGTLKRPLTTSTLLSHVQIALPQFSSPSTLFLSLDASYDGMEARSPPIEPGVCVAETFFEDTSPPRL